VVYNRKRYIKVVLSIVLLLLLLIAKESYAQYILTRNFTVNLSTASFSVNVINDIISVYDINTNKLSATIANNNNYNIKGNIVFNGNVIKTFEIQSQTTQTVSDITLTKEIVNGLSSGNYDLIVNITAPYSTSISNIKVNLKGTFSNEVNGVMVAGTSENPYIVYAVEDLVKFADNVNNGNSYSGKYITQERNINFINDEHYYNVSDTSFGNINGNDSDGNTIKTEMTTGTGFIRIGKEDEKPFSGTYDGGNHRVNNLLMINDIKDSRCGFFSNINNATIKNLDLRGNITCIGDAGTIVGTVFGQCNITNCINRAEIKNTTEGYSVGGLVGTVMANSTLTMKNCYNTGTITNANSTAGLVGFVISSTLNMEDCYNEGTIITTVAHNFNSATAGLAVKDSSSGGTINIKRCYNSGTINGKNDVAGLVSRSNGNLTIDSSYNIGSLIGIDNVGGLVAKQTKGSIIISNSYSAGTIKGNSYIGGLIGRRDGGTTTFINSYYLDSIANTALTNLVDSPNTMKRSDLQSQSFVDLLGSNFVYNSAGYPKLNWEEQVASEFALREMQK